MGAELCREPDCKVRAAREVKRERGVKKKKRVCEKNVSKMCVGGNKSQGLFLRWWAMLPFVFFFFFNPSLLFSMVGLPFESSFKVFCEALPPPFLVEDVNRFVNKLGFFVCACRMHCLSF